MRSILHAPAPPAQLSFAEFQSDPRMPSLFDIVAREDGRQRPFNVNQPIRATQKATPMNTVVPIRQQATTSELIESVIIRGDLSVLTPEQRNQYYLKVCETVGLNPLTKPFEYLTLNSKLVLYALKSCTDQLRTIHKISVTELTEADWEGVFMVTAKVSNGEGRTDAAKGAVCITGAKGEALANLLMKAETKAKRRATLSICGLGLLDEVEVEDIPAASKEPMRTLPKKDAKPTYTQLQAELDAITDCLALETWGKTSADRIKLLPEDWQDILRLRYQDKMLTLRQRGPVGASEPDHDADGVVWEETAERPATEADKPVDGTQPRFYREHAGFTVKPADDGIPQFLDRRVDALFEMLRAAEIRLAVAINAVAREKLSAPNDQ